jgi:hypothetical protein
MKRLLFLLIVLSSFTFGQTIRYNGSTRIQQYADSMKFDKLSKFHYGIWLQQSGNVGSLIYDDAGGRLGMSGGISLGGSTYGFSTRTLVDTMAGADSMMFSAVWKPQRWGLYAGTAASPVTVGGPTVKIIRRQDIDSTVTTQKADPSANAALEVQNFGNTHNYGQPIGIYGGATSTSNRSFTSGNDAAGGGFYGRINGAGTGIGIGLFADGRRDTAAASANAAQFSVSDWTGSDASYNTTGIDKTCGIWLSNHGNVGRKVASGIKFGNGDNIKFKYGIGFAMQSGGVDSANIITDDSAKIGFHIRGVHAQGAIRINDSLNYAGIGIGVAQGTALTRQLMLRQNNTTVASTPQFQIEQSGSGDAAMAFLLTSTRGWQWGVDNSDADAMKLSPSNDDFTGATVVYTTGGATGIGFSTTSGIDSALTVKTGTNLGSGTMLVNRTGTITKINSIATEGGFGVPTIVDTVSRGGLTTTQGATSLNGTAVNGVYEVSMYIYPTTAGTSGTVLGTIAWNDGAAETAVTGTHTFGALGGPVFVSSQVITVTNSTAITWATTVAANVGGVYVVNVVAKRLF